MEGGSPPQGWVSREAVGEKGQSPLPAGAAPVLNAGGFPLPPWFPSSHFSPSPSRMVDNNRIATIVPTTFAGLRSLYFL